MIQASVAVSNIQAAALGVVLVISSSISLQPCIKILAVISFTCC